MSNIELGYNNCIHRQIKTWIDKRKELRSYGRCRKDKKSCREWDMEGYDCYEV